MALVSCPLSFANDQRPMTNDIYSYFPNFSTRGKKVDTRSARLVTKVG